MSELTEEKKETRLLEATLLLASTAWSFIDCPGDVRNTEYACAKLEDAAVDTKYFAFIRAGCHSTKAMAKAVMKGEAPMDAYKMAVADLLHDIAEETNKEQFYHVFYVFACGLRNVDGERMFTW